ncbi:hypothetical protein K2173_016592 [Erythroxylum novogranatense]|uniref:Biogenesis of lysosome-related organelles complex 1 subunit 1 n=1 Tax=Erythroxylum novogranatense TaxID=1862640 RepID=A0AAV8SGN5_9ROSI|nr:hypothetical protein K2173_016592 [Erythroxylum novogranatense]
MACQNDSGVEKTTPNWVRSNKVKSEAMNPAQLPPSRSHSVASPSAMEKSQADTGDIQASLTQFINDHNQSSLRLREHTEKAKRDAIRKAVRVSDLLVDAVNGGVEQSFVNEKRIELEIRLLSATIARFMKQTDRWLATTHAFNTAFKEIGDIENWMRTMEFDCKSITAAIQNIHQE